MPLNSPSPRWGEDDVERLLRLIESGSSVEELSRVFGRTEVEVERQARFLGVLIHRHEELPVQTRTADSSCESATIHYAPFASSSRAEV